MSSWLNVTVTVKAAFSLVNTSSGIFNHTRLLHSVVRIVPSDLFHIQYKMQMFFYFFKQHTGCDEINAAQTLPMFVCVCVCAVDDRSSELSAGVSVSHTLVVLREVQYVLVCSDRLVSAPILKQHL